MRYEQERHFFRRLRRSKKQLSAFLHVGEAQQGTAACG